VTVRTEGLYYIFTVPSIPMKLVSPVKMCLNELYIEVFVGKHLSDAFPIHNGQKQGNASLSLH